MTVPGYSWKTRRPLSHWRTPGPDSSKGKVEFLWYWTCGTCWKSTLWKLPEVHSLGCCGKQFTTRCLIRGTRLGNSWGGCPQSVLAAGCCWLPALERHTAGVGQELLVLGTRSGSRTLPAHNVSLASFTGKSQHHVSQPRKNIERAKLHFYNLVRQ